MRTFFSDLFKYLAQKRHALLFFALCFVVLCGTFALYRLPLEAVVYPSLLCLLLGSAFFGSGFRQFRTRRRLLMKLFSCLDTLAEALPAPDSPIEADYQAVVNALCDARIQLETDMAARFDGMIDYFTLWVHQIKTPIAAMRLTLQNEDSPLSRRLTGELFRIDQYVDMVLTYLRLDTDSADYVIREHELDPILRGVIRKFSGEFITRRIALRYTPPDYRVVTDEKWLAFVLEQLLSNALKYTPSGSVSLYMETPGILCVQDTGIGIEPEDLPRIFEKGYTGHNGRADKRASGIGLYLCRRICRNLGFKLSAESTPGQGTLIRLDLTQLKTAPE